MTREPSKAFSDPEVIDFLKIRVIEKNTPIFIEVYRKLQTLIKKGTLKYGDALPSEPILAGMMCVSRNSLRTALSFLYEDHYVLIERGIGTYVLGDNRPEKYKRERPEGMIFPTERIALLGKLSRSKGRCTKVGNDDFLVEKLSPAGSAKVMQFIRTYYLNSQPAIQANYYYCDDLMPVSKNTTMDEVENKLIKILYDRTLAAEIEAAPAKMVVSRDDRKAFRGDSNLMVTTTFVGEQGVICYSKDYYNSDVIRFTTTLKNRSKS